MRAFFITGLPRTRSAWLANFFTCGKSFCWHDATVRAGFNAHAVVRHIARTGTEYVGDADSALSLFAADLVRLLPDAKWLVIDRNRDAAQASYERHFEKRPYPALPDNNPEMIRFAFDRAKEAVDKLETVLPPGKFLRVDFEDLNSKLVMHEAWNFLVPGVPWNPLRFDLLTGLEINVMPEKVKLCPPA